MLYVTTRDNKDAFTAHRALSTNTAADGGLYVPFRFPVYTEDEIAEMTQKSFGQIVAEVLNQFYASRLSGWDVELAVGKNACNVALMNHRIAVAELWRNPAGKFTYLVDSLYSAIYGATEQKPTTWFVVSVRIAVLFGLYAILVQQNAISVGQCIDIAVPVDDFSAPAAGFYARKMGLPIGVIVCTGDENCAVWDLLHRGTFSTSGVDKGLLLGIERLVFSGLGIEEAEKYRAAVEKGRSYSVSEELLQILSEGYFCAVAGANRSSNTINSVYRSNQYIMDPGAAVCYGGLQDYRARTGESSLSLIMSENTPMDATKEILAATGLTYEKMFGCVKL